MLMLQFEIFFVMEGNKLPLIAQILSRRLHIKILYLQKVQFEILFLSEILIKILF